MTLGIDGLLMVANQLHPSPSLSQYHSFNGQGFSLPMYLQYGDDNHSDELCLM
jgi:hypothetical protein